jgi:hypothetical protein
MKSWWGRRSGSERLILGAGGLLLLVAISLFPRQQMLGRTPTLPCSNDGGLGTIDGVCVGGYYVVASYDALPVVNQRELFRLQKDLPILNKGFVGLVDSLGQFRVKGNWLQRTNVIVDIEAAASFDYPERWPTVQKFLRDLGDPFNAAAKNKSSKDNKASCDPTNAWTLLKLREEPLRRCLRTVFLLDMTNTFNERTQKLFENQTIRYSNGTTGPLSLKRKGLTDSDRNKVMSAVKAIDKKARALGGYH